MVSPISPLPYIFPITGRPRNRWPDACTADWWHGEGKGYRKERGLDRGKTMDVETSWSEIITALVVVVIIVFLLLTY
jgi:hypothetical protein